MQSAQRFRIGSSIVVLLFSLFFLFNKMFTPQPIQIVLESGQAITTSTSEYFTLVEVLFLAVCAFLIGASAMYLYFNSNDDTPLNHAKAESASSPIVSSVHNFEKIFERLMPLLKHDERKVISLLKDSNGSILQNDLVLKLGESKVRVTRMLASLEAKQLIVKERHGMTNRIKLVS